MGFQPYADHDIYRASVMVGVCSGKVEEDLEFRGGGGEGRTTASLLGVQTNRYRHSPLLPEASETGGLLSQVETLDKQAA